MKYKLISSIGLIFSGVLFLITPSITFAQTETPTPSPTPTPTPYFNLGQAIKACNIASRDDSKEVEMEYRNKNITKEDRKSMIRNIKSTKLACIREAKLQAREDRQKRLEEARRKRSELKQAELQCNQTKKQDSQNVRQEYKDHIITRQEMNNQLRELEQERKSCIIQAREEIYNPS